MSNTIKSLNVKLALLSKGFEAKLGRVERKIRTSGRRLSALGSELSTAVSLPLAAIGTAALKSAGDLEALQLALRSTMVGAGRSVADVNEELKQLRKAALAPGLDFEQAVKASIRLQNVEQSAEDARRTIIELANAVAMSGGTAQDLDGVTIQFAQMISKGKVMSADLRIIQERLPVVTKLMREAFGTTSAEDLQRMGVTGQQFVEAITNGMAGMERVSGGLQNSMVNAFVSMRLAAAELGAAIDEAIDVRGNLNRFTEWLAGAVEWFKSLEKGTQATIIKVAAFAVALGPAMKLLGALQGLASMVVGRFKALVVVLRKVAGGVLFTAEAFSKLNLASKLSVIGLLATAIGAAALAYQRFRGAVVDTQKVMDDASLSVRQAQVAFNQEAEALKNANITAEERAALIRGINSKYGEYLGNLLDEKASIDDITTAQENANKAFEKKIMLVGFQALAAELSGKLAKAQAEAIRLQKAFSEVAGDVAGVAEGSAKSVLKYASSFLALGGGTPAALQISAAIERNRLEQEQLNEELASTQEAAKQAGIELSKVFDIAAGDKGGGDKPKGSDMPAGDGDSKVKTVSSVLAELNSEFEVATTKAKVFGNTFDLQAAKVTALQRAINDLIELGVKPGDEELVQLSLRYQNLTGDVELLADGLNSVASNLPELAVGVGDFSENVGAGLSGLGELIGEVAQGASMQMKRMAESGEVSFRRLGRAALKGAADVLRAKIIEGVASVVADALQKFGLIGLAIAGAAGAAAGALFNNIIGNIAVPQFAAGGMVTKPTLAMFGEYPGASTNPEFALRQDQLRGVIASAVQVATPGRGVDVRLSGDVRWNGRDFVIAFNEAQKKFGRGS